MNDITKVHLGRQAFTISIDAHNELKSYIEAISKQVKDKDVIEEIELRMSELLIEKGISSNKVILPKDIDYLKSQLGDPEDFKDDDDESELTTKTRRLFRDTDSGIIAGVASGLSKYFGLDVLLIRLLFILLVVVTAGWGILLYILLWLLVPEAKTSSERLQMAGKQVNLRSLKGVVEKADVKGAANRANNILAKPINNIFRLILKLIGLVFVIAGLGLIFGLVTSETYFLAKSSTWAQNNIFPIGFREHILFDVALAIAALISVFLILFGIAIFRRKWPIKTWVTGILIGLLLIGLCVGGALTAVIYPNVRDAYNANTHTTFRTVQPFNNLNVEGNIYNENIIQSDKYMVSFNYYGHPNLSTIKTTVTNGTLNIDGSNFNPNRDCSTVCIPDDYNLAINVYTPNSNQLQNTFDSATTAPEPPKIQAQFGN